MKFIIIFLMVTVITFSQTREPSQHTFSLNGNPIILNSTNNYFKLKNFQLGWHWGSMKVLSRALLMNQGDISTTTTSTFFKPGDFNDSTNYFVRAYYDTIIYGERIHGNLYTHTYYDNHIVFTNGMTYDPSLYIDQTDTFRLNIRAGDPQNPIFGFLKKRGRVPSSQSDPNYSRLIIDSTALINQVVLSEPWPNDQLTFRTKDQNGHPDPHIDSVFSGATYYVSINIRRIGGNLIQDDAPVLKIEVPFIYRYPYKTTAAEGKAVFDSIPGTSYNMLQNGRGNVLNLVGTGTNGTDTMIITRRMLPLLHEDNGDITICGYIDFRNHITDPPYIPPFNLPLRESVSDTEIDKIDQLKLKVTYLGNCDVAIDWIRFETPNTRRLHFGEHDVLIKQGIQHALDTLTKAGSTFNVAGNKMYRFIFNVEGGVRNWPIERYMSKLMGDIITGQNGLALIPQYDHYIGAADRWVSYIKTPAVLASPITASNWHQVNSVEQVYQGSDTLYNLNLWKTLGLTQGYVKHPNPLSNPPATPYFNIFKSDYETFLFSGQSPLSMRDTTMDFYLHNYNVGWEGNPVSTMVYWETFMRRMMFSQMESGFAFSDKPWFAQCFLQSEVKYDNIYTSNPLVTHKGYMYNGGHNNAVVNSELYRLMNWNPIILGAKGLMYDGDFDYPDQVKLVPHDEVLEERIPGYETILTDMEFLNHPRIDPDFLDTNYNHISPTMGGLLNTIYQPDTVAKYMGTLTNRFYMGKRSVRLEMRKLHEWIRENEDVLMAQRLQAWYSIGYKLWYKQHPTITQDTIMKNFINLSSIKTRRIFDVDSTGYKTTEPEYESTYETFADVTLLADTNDIGMDYSFTLGIQNKRTDPLIYFEEAPEDKHILFLSTAELDEMCEASMSKNPMRPNGQYYSGSIWQSYFWRRLGCREITIPMAFKKGIYNKGLISITAKELGVDNYDNLGIWYSEPYYHRIDTIIPIDGAIVSKHLPGQGKMIECKINSVFDNSESPCNICDFINNFNDFSISLVAQPKEGNNCCYNIEFTNHSDCSSGIIPVKLISNNSEQIQLDNLPFDDSNNSKILNTSYDISNAGTFSIGQLCVGESSEPVEFEIVFGSDIEGNFYGCDRKFKFVLNCEQDSIEAENCCDLFTVSSFYHPQPAPPAQRIACCTEIKINNYESNYCIKSISLDRYGTGNYTEFDSSIVEPIFSTVGFQTLTDICNPIASCLPGSNTLFSIERDLIFRGVDGEIICTKKVPIYYCCDIIQGPPGTFKTVQNNDATIPLIDNQIQLEIIPNPNDGFAKLRINSQAETNGKIKIMSSTGETLKEFHDITVKSNVEEIDLNLSDLSSGAYYLIFETELGVKSIQIIKLK